MSKDANLAVAWYRRAAENGDWTARIALGEMYARGEGVPKNAEAAVAWYRRDNTLEQEVSVPLNVEPYVEFVRKRAENGDANAHFNLGWMHHHGKGVPEDAAEAAVCYRKAAGQGDARAQFNLGVMYTLREGCRAISWKRTRGSKWRVRAMDRRRSLATVLSRLRGRQCRQSRAN